MNTTLIPSTSAYGNASDAILYHVNLNKFDARFFSAPLWLVIVMLIIAAWIIVANGLVFLCLVTSRNVLKNNVNVQLLGLSLTDTLVGIITVPLSLMPKMMPNSKYETCAFLLYLYLLAQSATLFHTLLICVNRLLTIRRRSSVNANTSGTFRTILMQIFAIWGCCLLGFVIHYIAFARFGATVPQCSTTRLFEDNEPLALGLLSYTLLVPPHLCTNIIYVYLFIYIRRQLRSVGVVKAIPNHLTEGDKLASYTTQEKQTQNLKTVGVAHTIQIVPFERTRPKMTQTMCVSIIEEQTAGPSTANDLKDCMSTDAHIDTHVKKEAIETSKRDENGTERSRAKINRLGWEKQNRVLVTFGILVLSLNVFMGPLSSMVIIEMIIDGPLSRDVRFVFVAMAMLNSGFNPIINTWRIKPFRAMISEKVTKIYYFLTFRQT